jgi:hypothetical protein
MKPTVPEALDKLAALGSPRQIADFLVQRQIKAFPSKLDRCAIAEYVRAETEIEVNVFCGGGAGADVCRDIKGVVRHDMNPNVGDVLPDVLQDFARGFDRGAYPELIAPSAARHYPSIEEYTKMLRSMH